MFGCYWKLGQTENVFSVNCKIRATGCKIFSIVIFTSNHFQKHAKRERRTHRRANRERDRAVEPTITPVKSPSSSPPRDGECSIHPSTSEITPQHPSTSEINPHPRAPIPPPWAPIHMTHSCPISLFLDLPLPFPHLSITLSSSFYNTPHTFIWGYYYIFF